MRMQWDRLLSDVRCPRPRKAGDEPKSSPREPFRSAFEADYDRIVYSAPFRRLARKTQVHPLAPNDQVHNRLTHSIEVASVGRSLARRLARWLQDRGEMPGARGEDVLWIVQAACVAHDIGNPPFGHAGEDAIREWVRSHADLIFFDDMDYSPAVRADWEWFEGNAQGFRIAARGDNERAGYLRLTFATLGAMMKYPWDSCDDRAASKKKFNVFSTEKTLFDPMVDRMGMNRADGTVARHPLSFLSEAADDICYRILDLEDAVEMGIISEQRVREVFTRIARPESDPSPLPAHRAIVIHTLIEGMWKVFADDYEHIMAGDREQDLKADLPPDIRAAIEQVKNLYVEIFAHRTKVATELGAYKVLGRIIRAMCLATSRLVKAGGYAKIGFVPGRCLELAWGEQYVRQHERETYEWWLHQVMDYVSGLTDNYARQLSREIEGT